jgi:HD-GYP domain-containing protein (c-di-GMP phosphodiesterase class II)
MPEGRKAPPGYIEIDLSLLQVDTTVDFDVYFWPDSAAKPVLYRDKDLSFEEEHRKRLREADAHIYILSDNVRVLNRYIERNLDRIVSSPTIPTKTKATILYKSSLMMVQDLLDKPDSPENFRRSEDVVRATIGYIMQGKDSFHQLMSLTSYDYYTYTHSVNVCTIGLALAEQVGLRSQADLMDFGVGALFHDVGKTKIPPSILRKKGPLSEAEWTEMRRHPDLGLALIDPSSPFSDASKAVIAQHHERIDGAGYPNGLSNGGIHPFARVAAIVDVFDALTSRRVYKDAVASYPALKIMREEAGTHFDDSYYRAFVKLLGR